MSEHECGFDDVADPAWASGDVPQGKPPPGNHGKPPFAQTPQPSQQGVVRAVVDIE
jgi:hypothetical protein